MAGADQYKAQMVYLREKAQKGELTYSNHVWQELDGKRNVPEVNAFLNSLEGKIK